MKKDRIKILAIESSCDETAASVIEGPALGVSPDLSAEQAVLIRDSGQDSCLRRNDNPMILSNIVSSQVDLHAKTGGVVPEVASRAHMEAIVPVIAQALLDARGEIPKSEYDPLNYQLLATSYSKSIEILRNEIDFIAYTAGPGLIGSLLVGYNAAKTIAYALDKPIIPINHIEGHIYSAFGGEIRNSKSEILNKPKNSKKENSKNVSNFELNASCFPLISLTVSGGHSSLTLMKDHGKYETIGETLDDAAGEAFDKVAKLLGLGYPGGPAVSKLASQFRAASNKKQVTRYYQSNPNGQLSNGKINGNWKMVNDKSILVFPRPILNDGTFNFSFSGLKTAVLQKVIEIKNDIFLSGHPEAKPKDPMRFFASAQNDTNNIELPLEIKQEIAAAFEDAVVDVLVTKTIRAVEKYKVKSVILAGGVAANEMLRNSLESRIMNQESSVNFLPAPKKLTGDNAAMIGLAAYYHARRGDSTTWDKAGVDSSLELE